MNIPAAFECKGIACNLGANGWHVDSGTAAIFEPATDEMIAWASNEIGIPFPAALISLLKSTNGCFFKIAALFGIPPSMFEGRGLSRIQLQPLAITTANKDWRKEYNAPVESIMVGSLQGWSENTGIFMLPTGACITIDSSGMSESFNLAEKLCLLAENA